jgi:hypothetical protein
MPLPNEGRNDTAIPCPACGQPFAPAGRRRWCSDACRQAAWRRRHPAAPAPAPPPPRKGRASIVYECGQCGQRYLGQQRCDDCATFCVRIGHGGTCPHCDEPVAINDLTATDSLELGTRA